ncbi:MAG TPA: hypothetical protein VI653_21030 [Steroidobacteraceae bacterium]
MVERIDFAGQDIDSQSKAAIPLRCMLTVMIEIVFRFESVPDPFENLL